MDKAAQDTIRLARADHHTKGAPHDSAKSATAANILHT